MSLIERLSMSAALVGSLAYSTSINFEPDFSQTKIGIVYVDPQYVYLMMVPPEELESDFQHQKEVLRLASNNDIPTLIFLYEGFGGIYSKVRDDVNSIPNHRIIEKNKDDGFRNYTGKLNPSEWFKEQEVTTLYFMGVRTKDCVLYSSLGAYIGGFEIMTSKDVIFDSYPESHMKVREAFDHFQEISTLCETYEECLSPFYNLQIP